MNEAEHAESKRKAGAPPRRVLAEARSTLKQGAHVVRAPAKLRDQAKRAADKLRNVQVDATLRTTPVSKLRELAGKGVRFGELERSRFRTVAAVLSASPAALEGVPGVGAKSVPGISAAARTFAEQVRGEAVIRFDPDRRDPRETALLGVLAALRDAERAATALREPVDQFTRRATPLLKTAKRAGSRVMMFFSGKATRSAALAALVQLEEILADPRVVAQRRDIAAAATIDPARYPAEELWHNYVQDAASVNALLSGVPGATLSDSTEAARGFVSAELIRQIQAVPLNTTLLTARLRGYQVFGAQYAILQKRAILGDEMGLGKTIQALATAAHLVANGQRRVLVVCPASVLVNWINEIAKHTRLTAHSLYGSDRDAVTEEWAARGGIAVTTFTTLGRLPIARNSAFALLIVDEAHLIKNPNTQRSAAVQSVAARAQRILFLTGTPMENRVEEFRTLVKYLQPKIASTVRVGDTVAGARTFRRAVAPVYLRRNQEDVLTELPERIEVEDWVQFTDSDQRVYIDAVASRNFMRMRQAAFAGAGQRNSAKLERLLEIVKESADSGWKVIVFSYFIDVLQTIHTAIGQAAVGPMTGAVSPSKRQELVDEFSRRKGHAVLISQIEAGGVGLNIQAASVVIIAEPQWKPSTEEQAIARAHRMGQTRKVHVHRLLVKDSVDERIRDVLARKIQLFDAYARKSAAKEADLRAVDPSLHQPDVLDDEAIPLQERIITMERQRLGL